MTTLWQKGIRGKLWRMIKNLNNDLTTKIKTRYGYTRTVSIEESIRQGGVLSGAEFASLIDSAENALQEAELGISFGTTKLASLLLMDDIILLADNQTQLQAMLNTLDKFATKWHLTFNPTKSKVMVVGHADRPHQQWRLGQLILEETERYTYLGEVISSDLQMQAHINYLQQKLIANTNQIFAIGSDESLSRIKMSTYMQLHERCLIPSLLYNAETWTMSKDETRRLEQLQLRTLRTYLKAPRSVPKMAFYLELGLYPVEATIDITQIKYLWKLLNTTTQVRAILETQLHLDTSGS